ncbi:MAG TPA: acylphosphatase [Kofleriaceae bacterium]|nr:acylphosphatase [Kofleriaceae bacterium]
MADRRARIRVTGLVQGVYYRASTAEQAERLGLSGWVRNCDDGSVELEAEGSEERVRELAAWCRRGPPAAQVSGVDVAWIEPTGADRGFRVRR